MARLLERYQKEIVPRLRQELGQANALAVPRLVKIVVSAGLGKAVAEKKRLETAADELAKITGQKPLVCRARKSVSNFKLRQGMEIGAKVTLRGRRMYEFLDRLIALAIPRVRDFRGLSPNAFDGRGNYNLGLAEQTVFPEIEADKVEFAQGMNVTLVTSAGNDERARRLLQLFGMPFREK
jgi:large subunit ribosomal protein L5